MVIANLNYRMISLSIEQRITAIYRHESSQVLATLVRLLQDNFDLAEDALQDAFVAALSQWQP